MQFPMNAAKQEVQELLNKLPDDCSFEDIQYHLYVLEKVRRGMEHIDSEGGISQTDAEARPSKWVTK